jgi:hypothetical protein
MELHHRTPPTTAEVVTLIYLRILSYPQEGEMSENFKYLWLVIGDHNCVSDFQNSLILIADEFLDPGIILAEVTDVALRQKFPVGGKDGHR